MDGAVNASAKELTHQGVIGAINLCDAALPLNFPVIEKNEAIASATNGTFLMGNHHIGIASPRTGLQVAD
jgi:hypothetical protein